MPFRTVIIRSLSATGAVAAIVVVWALFGDSKITVLVAIAGFLVLILPWLPGWQSLTTAPSRPDQIDAAANALIRSVRAQWVAEQHRRGLEDPHSMPIRWSVDSNTSWRAVSRNAASSEKLDSIIARFVARPSRLVVTGDPGSGKTGLCVLLTLALLTDQSDHRGIPFLVPLSSWDPSENLNTWLARRLANDYPWLTSPAIYGATACAELVTQWRILPLLDGLDEVSPSNRADVLDAILRDLAGQPFVLTCRSNEFAAIQAKPAFDDLFVIELLPLEPAAAAEYLLESVPGNDLERWDAVLSSLSEGTAGPVETACTRPWTLFLLQAVYHSPDSNPAELLEADRFPTVQAIEERLLDAFVRVAFTTRPPPPQQVTGSTKRWDPGRSEKGMIFLAKVLSERSSRELAWWDLAGLVPAWFALVLRVSIGSVADAILCAALFGLFGHPWFGAAFGLVTGAIVALALGLVPAERPRRLVFWSSRRRFAFRSLLLDAGFILVGGVGGGAVVYILYGPLYGVLAGVVFGAIFALVRRLIEPAEPKIAVSPVGVLRDDRRSVLYATGIGWLTGAVVGGLLGGIISGDSRDLIFHLNTWQRSALGAVVGATLCAGVLGLMMHSNSASGRFVTTQTWLSARQLTPVPLMAFLEDAHRLGVLRQIGAYYQFRHASLQDWLAARPLPMNKNQQ
jgi:NACHT domain